MKLIDYARDIELFEVFDKDINPMSSSEKYRAVRILIDYFSREDNLKIKRLPDNYDERRNILHGLLDKNPPRNIDSVNLELLERLLITECKEKNIVKVDSLEVVKENIFLYKGDITNIEVDAIVNSSNDSIYLSAGPRMRIDCNKIIEKQNHLDYIGDAKITRGYCLPSKYVLHTVGPVVLGNNITKEQAKQLRSCYKSCLNLIKDIDEIQSITFSSISTGAFGYPKENAAIVAVETVKEWILENTDRDLRIIFNVSNENEYEIYKKIIKEKF